MKSILILLNLIAVSFAGLYNKQGAGNILSVHNKLRSMMAGGNKSEDYYNKLPIASNMLKMTWSNSLALAHENRSCEYLASKYNKPVEGENIYYYLVYPHLKKQSDENATIISQIIEDDFLLSRGADFGFFMEATPKNLQVVWASAASVGCGFKECSSPEKSESHALRRYTICNYSGRRIGREKPFIVGKQCSNCPTGTNCKDNSFLCF